MDEDEHVKSLFRICQPLISTEGASQVQHYLDHGEHEMAFEGMVLELISANARPPNFRFEEWAELARAMGLEEESIFDGGFWTKFENWGQQHESG